MLRIQVTKSRGVPLLTGPISYHDLNCYIMKHDLQGLFLLKNVSHNIKYQGAKNFTLVARMHNGSSISY